MIDANIKRFVELVRENQDLRVIYMVYSDVVQDDFHDYWLSRSTDVKVDSILDDDLHERIWIRSINDDYEIYESFFGDEDCTDEHIKEEVDKLPWEKVIIVWIGS